MNERVLRGLAIRSVAALLVTMAISYGMYGLHGRGVFWLADAFFSKSARDDAGLLGEAKETVSQQAESYLVIEKPEKKSYELSVEDLYMERSLKISIANLEEKAFAKESLSAGDGADAQIEKASLIYDYDLEASSYTAVYEVAFNALYAYQVSEDERAIYIELWEPSKLYDKILVVDAGHGGNDIGTYSSDMKYHEKDINLSIAKYLKKLLDKEKIKVYYTRLADEKVYLNPRIDLANELKADLFLSIHCNSSDNAKASGCEVLYGTKNQKNLAFASKDFADICLKAMTEDGSLQSRGLVKNNDIHIIGKSKVPVALVEAGFMTNKADLRLLTKKKGQKQIAEYMYQAIMAAFSQIEE